MKQRQLTACLALAVVLLSSSFAAAQINHDDPVVKDANGKTRTAGVIPELVDAFLKTHNDARAAVGAPPLKWSAQLCTQACIFSEELAKVGQLKHSGVQGQGENLSAASRGPYDGPDAAKTWLKEKADYVYGPIANEPSVKTLHYSQMVWKNTTHVGFFSTTDAQGRVFVVARYAPAGNTVGEKPY